MTVKPLKPLLLALAITTTLAACNRAEPAAAAAAPAEPAKLTVDLSQIDTLAPAISLAAADIDAGVNVCQDLNGYVNAKWLAANPVPADRTTWGAFPALGERSLNIQHEIAKAAAAGNWAKDSMEQRVGDFFAAGMDEAAIEAAGLSPIQPTLDRIETIAQTADIADYLREEYAKGQGMLFGFYASPDIKDSTVNIANVSQGGLSLPERAYYLEDREDYKQARAAFLLHVARIMELGGATPEVARTQAEQVLAFETRLAKPSLDRVSMRDPANRYNPVDLATADALTPNFPWTKMFESQAVPAPKMFSLAQTEFFKEFDRMLVEVPVEEWKTWLRFSTLDNAAPYLTKAFELQSFEFYSKTLGGQKEMQPRWKRVLGALNGSFGEGFGQLYVAQAFPAESKAKMEQLVGNLRASLKARLENLEWMSADTRAKALEKLSSFTTKIGYPDKWRDWSGLSFSRDSYVGNLIAATAYNYRWNIDKIGQPVDRSEWGMSPQTVNAYYRQTANEVVFPAAILQPPFFDPQADDALNYGGIGGVIGHEIMHGFDDQGSKFDGAGNFTDWWTAEDRAKFEERAAKLAAQFDKYEPLPGMFVNGKLGLGENIADLGGVTVALEALKAARGDAEDPMIDGHSQVQRFFLNWATVWRIAYTEEQLKQQITVGPHSPGMFRAISPASNHPAFAEAFSCKAGDPMARSGDNQVTIW